MLTEAFYKHNVNSSLLKDEGRVDLVRCHSSLDKSRSSCSLTAHCTEVNTVGVKIPQKKCFVLFFSLGHE